MRQPARGVLRETGAAEVHVVGSEAAPSPMAHRNDRVFMGTELRSPEYWRTVTTSAAVAELVKATS